MGRHGAAGGGQRGAHRAEPADSGPIATVGHVLGSTVPRKVRPPRLLRVLVISGITVGMVLFAYSTTQIYLRFSDPGTQQITPGDPGDSGRLPATETSPRPSVSPEVVASPETETVQPDSDTERGPADHTGSATAEQQPVPGPGADRATDGAAPAVSYAMNPYSDNAFGGSVTITNTGDGTLSSWELVLGFSDVRIESAWEAEWEPTADGMVARQPDWRSGIAPGESVTVNFTAQGRPQYPASCSLNGGPCGL
ncbi:cellulose binding domain-containing protein [Marinactinospora rubrisoli]|uniref:Cellulose binding domain-containing protein n=1 Tax=Marinactinospora rubrisoli TaxID=2715399 RepID=A0ABW2KCP9_9ACTN